MQDKFSAEDRKLVVAELEKIQKSKLTTVKPSQKFFKDENGKHYCIFGGKEDWHGVSGALMQQLEENAPSTLLVIVKKYRTRIDVCVATIEDFTKHKTALSSTRSGGYQFHTILTEDGMFVEEIPEVQLKKIREIVLVGRTSEKFDLSEVQKIINVEMLTDVNLPDVDQEELTHSDLQAKIILIGNLLGHRTYTPDIGKTSRYGKLGDLCSDTTVPDEAISQRQIGTVKNIDVIWFDAEGWPTHCFEVEHSTDITKGLLRLYQTYKLRIKMFIVAREASRPKFETELKKSPFFKIKEQFIFRTYGDLDAFLEATKKFTLSKGKFLDED